MKKILLLFAVLLTEISASAYDFEVNGFYYNKNSDGKSVSVTHDDDFFYKRYSGNVTIPSAVTYEEVTYTVTEIGDRAFYGCNQMWSVVMPNTITKIGRSAFYDCFSLSSVKFSNSLTEIWDDAFRGCRILSSVELPNTVTLIRNCAFFCCSELKTASLGTSLKWIGSSAFSYCIALSEIVFPNSLQTIGDSAFESCASLTSVEIPNSVTEIGSGAFSYCRSLVSFHGKYSSADHRCLIDDDQLIAFAPAGLTSYAIPGSVAIIGESALADENELTSVVIPSSVVRIKDNAFRDNSNIEEIFSLNTTPPVLGMDCFYGLSKNKCTLKVPEESLDSYKAAEGWKHFKNIVGIDVNAITSVSGEPFFGETFTTSGQPVGSNYRGIVICDGKKLLVK